MELIDKWLEAKAAETAAIEDRRQLEDELLEEIGYKFFEGTKTIEQGGAKIRVVGRVTRKINSNTLQELAAEHGLTDHLSTLFRWKPEIELRKWAAADKSITKPLESAITTKFGRPSISITKE